MMKSQATKDEASIAPVLWAVAIVGVLLALASASLFGSRGFTSTLIGAALAVANLWAMARLVRGLLGAGPGRAAWGPLGMVKIAALFLVLWIILKRGYADVLPLALGYAALPVGIVLAQLRNGGDN
ncbi:MAG TPA: ATP synthase subunit I [Polyangiaceae bacterium]|nr:ATP synthase subunit I [Polyangiaceae bacterium]